MEKCGDGEVTKLNVEEERLVLCGRSDGKRWKCKKQAAKGEVFCNHHLEQIRNNYEITRNKKMMMMKKPGEEEGEEVEERIVLCRKRNGNGWKCKKQAAKGQVLCEHHLEQLRNHQITRRRRKKKMMTTEKETERGDQVRGRRVRARKAALDSNPSDYYYYSGFGPSWGKRRGNTNIIKNNEYVENEYSKCDNDDDKIGKKRGGSPKNLLLKNNEFVAQEEEEEEEEGSILSYSSCEMCEIDEIEHSKGEDDDDEIGKKRGGSVIINLGLEEDEERKVLCRRMSGIGWKCHAVAARGKLLCEHHLKQNRNYKSKKKKMKATFSSNSHLCSSNGIPDWGKNIAIDTESDEAFAQYEDVRFSPSACDISEIDRIRIDYAEDDDED